MGQDQQLSMFDGKAVNGVQNKISGTKFAQDAQPTRQIEWGEGGYAIVRWKCKPSTGFKEAVTEDKREVIVREQELEVVEFYEVDTMTGKTLIAEGHEEAAKVVAERYAVEINGDAMAS